MATHGSERRAGRRVPVQAPVKVRKSDGTETTGLTRDLSSNGIFLHSETGMEAGSKLELVVMLPPDLGIGPGLVTLIIAATSVVTMIVAMLVAWGAVRVRPLDVLRYE